MSLLDRCLEFYKLQGVNGMLRQGGPVQDLHDFVLSEIGRAADSKLSDSKPLVLYFQTDQDRDELIAAIMYEKPNMIGRKWP